MLLLLLLAQTTAASRSIPPFYVYPAPTASFPSSPFFSVTVGFTYANGSVASAPKPVHVYFDSIAHRAMYNGAQPSQARQDQSVSFFGFAFDDAIVSAEVSVTSSFEFSDCVLRPLSYGLKCRTQGGNSNNNTSKATVSLNRTMRKVSLELLSTTVGNSLDFVATPLLIFADPPEDPALVPSEGTPGVLYFARGVHNLSGQVDLECGTNHVYVCRRSHRLQTTHESLTSLLAHAYMSTLDHA
jgi:hypothetical protein